MDRCDFASKCKDILLHNGWKFEADTFEHDADRATCVLYEGNEILCDSLGGPPEPEYVRWCVDGRATTWREDRATTEALMVDLGEGVSQSENNTALPDGSVFNKD